MYLVAGTVYQFGGGSWYSLTPTQNFGSTPPTGGAGGGFTGPSSANPLVLTISGLQTGQSYDFQVNVTNSSTTGPFSSPITVTASGPVVTAVNLSNTSVGGGLSVPQPVGTISVTMSSGTFSGTLAVNDTAHFSISGSTLNTAAVLTAGQTYPITITATPTGGTAFPQNFTITATSVTITAINLSNNTVASNTAPPLVVGAVSVTLSAGSFTGSLSVTGTNASSFAISGSNLVTAASLAPGTYSIALRATQAGITNSPFTGPTITITAQATAAVQTFAVFNDGNYSTAETATSNRITGFGPYIGGSGSATWDSGASPSFQSDLSDREFQLNGNTGLPTNPGVPYLLWALMIASPEANGGFSNVAAGQHDADFQSLVNAVVTTYGYKRWGARLGWEMNLGWPWDARSNPAGYVSAFQHVATFLRSASAALGATVDIYWCPGAGNTDPRVAMYPGDAYVDYLAMDFGTGGNINDITGNGGWSFASMADASVNGFRDGNGVLQGKGKAIAVCEGEISVTNTAGNQYPNYCTAMQNVITSTGARVRFYEVYDEPLTGSVPWGNSTAVNALNAWFTTASNFKATS
jgi:hypothetical protein